MQKCAFSINSNEQPFFFITSLTQQVQSLNDKNQTINKLEQENKTLTSLFEFADKDQVKTLIDREKRQRDTIARLEANVTRLNQEKQEAALNYQQCLNAMLNTQAQTENRFTGPTDGYF